MTNKTDNEKLIAEAVEIREALISNSSGVTRISFFNDVIDALQAAQAQAVPDRWKLVPIEPTEEMREAGNSRLMEILRGETPSIIDRAYYVYKAMLTTAAPTPAGSQQNTDYARGIAVHLAMKLYPKQGFSPLDDLNGILSQIDNMVCGIQPPAANAAQDVPTIGAVMPNGVMVANVYEAYDAGYMHALKTPAKREGE